MSDAGFLKRALARLGRALDPGAESDREQLRALLDAMQDWQTRDDVRSREYVARLRAVEASSDAVRRDLGGNQKRLARIRHLLLRQRELVAQLSRRAGMDRQAVEVEQQVTDRLTKLSRSRLPIVVGPWTGEVGFELLYWIPFLQWVRETFPLDHNRLIVVSRGGVRSWYDHVARHYEDIFCHTTTAEFQQATAERKKQMRIGAFDRQIVRSVLRRRGIGHAHLLHPTLMYALFNSFWRYTTTVKRLESFSSFRHLAPIDPDTQSTLSLPEQFVAVRFYFSDCFPDTPDNRRFAARVIDGLAARGDVVLLNSDLVVDDHRDFTPSHASRVHVLNATMQPENNLALQTAAISRARAFVGTYGGYSYLAPLYGVSSVAFYARTTFKQHHLELAHRAFLKLGTARLVPVDVRRAELLGDALAGVVTTPAIQ